MFEATEENREKLINEVYKLFSSAKGNCDRKEEKKDKRICIKNNIDIYTVIPQGWRS